MVDVEPQILAAAARLDDLDAEALELVAMMVVDGAQPDLDQAVGEPLLHDPGEGRGVGPRVVLIGMIDVGVRVDVEDGQARMAAAHGAHDRIGDGMVAAEADQRIARIQRAPDTRSMSSHGSPAPSKRMSP